MSAETASAALAQLLADPPSWLPPVDHWEVATDTGHGHGVWTVSGQLAYDGTGDTRPYELMRPIAVESDEPLDDNGRAIRARFQHDGVLFTVWWLRPITRWLVSDCATCQTPLGDPRVSFEQIGTGDDRRVICVPCRDRMHAAWLAGGPDRAAALLAAADTINALAQDYELDPGRGECAALLRRMAAAGLEKDTPAGGESTPATDRRARYIAALRAADTYAQLDNPDDRARFADAAMATADAELHPVYRDGYATGREHAGAAGWRLDGFTAVAGGVRCRTCGVIAGKAAFLLDLMALAARHDCSRPRTLPYTREDDSR